MSSVNSFWSQSNCSHASKISTCFAESRCKYPALARFNPLKGQPGRLRTARVWENISGLTSLWMTVIVTGKLSNRKLFTTRKMEITYKQNVNGSILILTYLYRSLWKFVYETFFLVLLFGEGRKKNATVENSKFISCQSLVTVADQILQCKHFPLMLGFICSNLGM